MIVDEDNMASMTTAFQLNGQSKFATGTATASKTAKMLKKTV